MISSLRDLTPLTQGVQNPRRLHCVRRLDAYPLIQRKTMSQRNVRQIALAVVVVSSIGVYSASAAAAGCNGVVNPAVWGCAPWDNNNGPKFPNYKPKKAPQPAAAPAAKTTPTPLAQRPVAHPGNASGIISRDGAGIISRDGAGIISRDGAVMRK
jgi:hypothetical protein